MTHVVLWDFDGTLAWRELRWRGSLLTALSHVDPGHRVTDELIRPGLKSRFPWHRHQDPHHHLSTAELWWDAMTEVFVNAYRQAGVDDVTARAASALVREVYADPRFWTVWPDVRPVLTRLRQAGWRHVIVSNHIPELPGLVEVLGLADLFDDVITSAVAGFEKPHPEIFRYALAVAGHPPNVWMVGDNPIADVAGATEAGIPAILVRTIGPRGEPEVDLDTAARMIVHG